MTGIPGYPQPDASGHARETCPAMTSADLARRAPHWCLASIRSPLPGGGWVSTVGPWTNVELAALRGRFAELDRQLFALEQLEPGESDQDLDRLAHLFLTGLTAAEMIARAGGQPGQLEQLGQPGQLEQLEQLEQPAGPRYLTTEPGTQIEWTLGRPRAWHRTVNRWRRILAYLRAVTGL